MKKRVIMLMSGGVDSSVSAALLKDQGYDVIGVYILGWTGTKDFPCNWQQEEADAKNVAEQLQLPFYTVNLSKEYEKEVIDRFFAGYKQGVTPNPDILCNREIKFKALWQTVRQFEPDFIATGHYAQLKKIPSTKHQTPDKFQILKGKDPNKDQTYFLWGIDAAILPHLIFPIGHLKKPQVRALAKKYQLPTATKKDSQGICFIGSLKVREFLAKRLQPKPGLAILTDGRVIANHDGVELYTIGQRLAAGSVNWTGDVPPLFVIAKDLQNNRLIVGTDAETYADFLEAGDADWLSADAALFVRAAKIRYRQKEVGITMHKVGRRLEVSFEEPVRAMTPGQSIVFYGSDEQLLGGALISRVPAQDQIIAKSHVQV